MTRIQNSDSADWYIKILIRNLDSVGYGSKISIRDLDSAFRVAGIRFGLTKVQISNNKHTKQNPPILIVVSKL